MALSRGRKEKTVTRENISKKNEKRGLTAD